MPQKQTKEALATLLQENIMGDKPFVLAMDGRAAAGKSTLSCELARRFNGAVVHMDDFYLPRKFHEGISVPAGNIDKARFLQEVIEPLKRGQPFAYRVFDCRIQDFAPGDIRIGSPFVIVEGAYSLLPLWGDYYQLSLFYDIEPALQRSRILNRNGESGLMAFQKEWIPREELYIEACQVKQRCQYIIQ